MLDLCSWCSRSFVHPGATAGWPATAHSDPSAAAHPQAEQLRPEGAERSPHAGEVGAQPAQPRHLDPQACDLPLDRPAPGDHDQRSTERRHHRHGPEQRHPRGPASSAVPPVGGQELSEPPAGTEELVEVDEIVVLERRADRVGLHQL